MVVQQQFYQENSRLGEGNPFQGHHHVHDRIPVRKNQLIDKSPCNKLSGGGITNVYPKGDCSEALRQAGEDDEGRVKVRIPVQRTNGIEDPDQVRFAGSKAKVSVAKV